MSVDRCMSVPSTSHRIAQQLLMEKKKKIRSCRCTGLPPTFTKAFLQSSLRSWLNSQALPSRFPLPTVLGRTQCWGMVTLNMNSLRRLQSIHYKHAYVLLVTHSRDRLQSGSLLLVLLLTFIFLTTGVSHIFLQLVPSLLAWFIYCPENILSRGHLLFIRQQGSDTEGQSACSLQTEHLSLWAH